MWQISFCLITKHYVYRQRCQGKEILFPELKRYILSIETMEKYIAIKNQKLNLHLKKWRQRNVINNRESVDEFCQRYLTA